MKQRTQSFTTLVHCWQICHVKIIHHISLFYNLKLLEHFDLATRQNLTVCNYNIKEEKDLRIYIETTETEQNESNTRMVAFICRQRNIAKCDYQEIVSTAQQQMDRHLSKKVILICRYASKATQQRTRNWKSRSALLGVYVTYNLNLVNLKFGKYKCTSIFTWLKTVE